MSALANTIRMLSGRLALLRAERERYQALCAAAYQLAGAMSAPVRFLDAFSDGANGEIEARQKTEDLTPVDSKEMGAFPGEIHLTEREKGAIEFAIGYMSENSLDPNGIGRFIVEEVENLKLILARHSVEKTEE